MISDLTKSYLAELDARAAQGDTRARDYGDVCRLEFEQRLEGCILALMKRDRDEGRAEWIAPSPTTSPAVHTVTVVGALVAPLNWGDTTNGNEPSAVASSAAPRQGSLF